MNKIYQLTICCFLSVSSYAQFSISLGASRVKENIFGEYNPSIFEKQQPFLYNSYCIQTDYTKSFFRVYTEMGYLPGVFDYKRHSSYHIGGGSSSSYSEYRTYNSKIDFGYYTFKLGIGTEIKKKWNNKMWCSFSYNIFGQYDKLQHKSESNQVMYKTTTTNPMQNQYVHTVYPPNYYPFELTSYYENVIQFGVELKGRIGWNIFYTELSAQLSSYVKDRSYIVIFDYNSADPNASTTWCATFGVKIGAYLRKKVKENKNQ